MGRRRGNPPQLWSRDLRKCGEVSSGGESKYVFVDRFRVGISAEKTKGRKEDDERRTMIGRMYKYQKGRNIEVSDLEEGASVTCIQPHL